MFPCCGHLDSNIDIELPRAPHNSAESNDGGLGKLKRSSLHVKTLPVVIPPKKAQKLIDWIDEDNKKLDKPNIKDLPNKV